MVRRRIKSGDGGIAKDMEKITKRIQLSIDEYFHRQL